MNEKTQQLIKKYIDIVLARKTLIATLVFIALVGGTAIYYKTPKVYQATSLLIYEKQKINSSKMSPELHEKVREIVNTLMQEVTSRTSLEKVILEFDLYSGMREELPIEDVIEFMRRQIQISPTKGDVFQVSYYGSDPRKVLRVTNSLASKFIEENLKYREESASKTSEYIANELQLAKTSLDQQELAMRDYKLKFYNELPEQRKINVDRANTLQVKLQGVQNNIQELERTKIVLQEQIGQRRQLLKTTVANQMLQEGNNSDVAHEGDPYQQLARMQSYLATLQVKYKETHPEVKHVKAAISALEERLADEGMHQKTAGMDQGGSLLSRDPVLQAASIQRGDIERNLRALREDEKELRAQIKRLEAWIAAAPVREAEWSALTRDYNQLKGHYDFLVAQNLQASSVENLEKRQQGSQFRIMDPARLPQKPVKPDFVKIMVLAVGLGLALGGGLALAFDMVDTSFKDPLEVEEYLGLSVICSIPYLPLAREKKVARWKNIGFVIYLLSGIILLGGGLFFLWSRGTVIL